MPMVRVKADVVVTQDEVEVAATTKPMMGNFMIGIVVDRKCSLLGLM